MLVAFISNQCCLITFLFWPIALRNFPERTGSTSALVIPSSFMDTRGEAIGSPARLYINTNFQVLRGIAWYILFGIVLYCLILHGIVRLYITTKLPSQPTFDLTYSTSRQLTTHHFVLYDIVWYCKIMYDIVWHCIIFHGANKNIAKATTNL